MKEEDRLWCLYYKKEREKKRRREIEQESDITKLNRIRTERENILNCITMNGRKEEIEENRVLCDRFFFCIFFHGLILCSVYEHKCTHKTTTLKRWPRSTWTSISSSLWTTDFGSLFFVFYVCTTTSNLGWHSKIKLISVQPDLLRIRNFKKLKYNIIPFTQFQSFRLEFLYLNSILYKRDKFKFHKFSFYKKLIYVIFLKIIL